MNISCLNQAAEDQTAWRSADTYWYLLPNVTNKNHIWVCKVNQQHLTTTGFDPVASNLRLKRHVGQRLAMARLVPKDRGWLNPHWLKKKNKGCVGSMVALFIRQVGKWFFVSFWGLSVSQAAELKRREQKRQIYSQYLRWHLKVSKHISGWQESKSRWRNTAATLGGRTIKK